MPGPPPRGARSPPPGPPKKPRRKQTTAPPRKKASPAKIKTYASAHTTPLTSPQSSQNSNYSPIINNPNNTNNTNNDNNSNTYFDIGTCVELTHDRKGIIAYCGNVHFDNGKWYGIELIYPPDIAGSHSGTVGEHKYFSTRIENKGIFVPVNSDKIIQQVTDSQHASEMISHVPKPAHKDKDKDKDGKSAKIAKIAQMSKNGNSMGMGMGGMMGALAKEFALKKENARMNSDIRGSVGDHGGTVTPSKMISKSKSKSNQTNRTERGLSDSPDAPSSFDITANSGVVRSGITGISGRSGTGGSGSGADTDKTPLDAPVMDIDVLEEDDAEFTLSPNSSMKSNFSQISRTIGKASSSTNVFGNRVRMRNKNNTNNNNNNNGGGIFGSKEYSTPQIGVGSGHRVNAPPRNVFDQKSKSVNTFNNNYRNNNDNGHGNSNGKNNSEESKYESTSPDTLSQVTYTPLHRDTMSVSYSMGQSIGATFAQDRARILAMRNKNNKNNNGNTNINNNHNNNDNINNKQNNTTGNASMSSISVTGPTENVEKDSSVSLSQISESDTDQLSLDFVASVRDQSGSLAGHVILNKPLQKEKKQLRKQIKDLEKSYNIKEHALTELTRQELNETLENIKPIDMMDILLQFMEDSSIDWKETQMLMKMLS